MQVLTPRLRDLQIMIAITLGFKGQFIIIDTTGFVTFSPQGVNHGFPHLAGCFGFFPFSSIDPKKTILT